MSNQTSGTVELFENPPIVFRRLTYNFGTEHGAISADTNRRSHVDNMWSKDWVYFSQNVPGLNLRGTI
jgi:hypothetical protein